MSKMSTHLQAPLTANVTLVNVTNVSLVSVSLDATLSKLGTPPEVAPLSKLGTPPEVAPLSKVDVPPEVTTESTVNVPPDVSVASTESVPLKETVESTESTPPEVTSELTESVPPEANESMPLDVISELTETVPPEATISELTESVPPEAAILSFVTSVAQELIVEPTESSPSEVTSESTESVPPQLTLEPTENAPSEVTKLPVVTAPLKVTTASSENIPPESTTMSSVSVLTPELTQAREEAREDAIQLRRAFKGLGCDTPTIVKILAHRSATQRAFIRREYKIEFSEDLDNRLSTELKLSRDLKRAVLLWMHDPATRDAVLVKQGLTENFTLKVAIEVICSRTPSQIERLKKAYRPLFDSYLEQDIESHASGDNKKLLLAYAGKSRSEGPEVDKMMVDRDAKALFKDGEYKLGTNEETFIRIFSERSWAHLAAVGAAYRSMYVNSLKKAVKNETSWNFKCALLTILQCAENPAKYFAKVLHKAMDGLGTDEKTLSRIIVSRAEIDIQQIKEEYKKKYKKSLSDEVHSETSGNYRAFLLSLLDTHN